MRLFKIGLFLICFFILFCTAPVFAASDSFKNEYKVEYIIPDQIQTANPAVDVHFTITVTNLKTDEYVDKISLSFPKEFEVRDVIASDEHGQVTPIITGDESKIKLTLKFNDPSYGKDTKNIFNLRLRQSGLLRAQGNVYEMIVPTVSQTSGYEIFLTLPAGSSKKLSIAKPKPSAVENRRIIWKNPSAKTIYAVFGSVQNYNFDLAYHLKNDKIIPVYQDIALPPDMLHQKIFIDSIEPEPQKILHDEDGNYMARIYLAPGATQNVRVQGGASVFAEPRDELIPYVRSELKIQKSYLLDLVEHFELSKNQALMRMNSPRSVYRYITSRLTYNFAKVTRETQRLGAAEALKSPENAICTEFTDSFVAVARKNNIYAREIEGYGFSEDMHLRPLSLVSDVLHAWPEYYDDQKDMWVSVDPTWESTSGIDYFSSFDLNHIAFAIHGKSSSYPYPAGSYKTGESKDVSVNISKNAPSETKKILVVESSVPERLSSSQQSSVKLKIKNAGNTYLWNETLTISSSNLKLSVNEVPIPRLAPYEEQDIEIPFSASEIQKKSKGTVTVHVFGGLLYEAEVTITPMYYTYIGILAVLAALAIVFAGIYMLVKKRFFSTPHG